MKLTAGQLWLPLCSVTLMTRPWGDENLHTVAPIFIIGKVSDRSEYSILTWELMTEHGIMYSYDQHLTRYVSYGATLLMSAE